MAAKDTGQPPALFGDRVVPAPLELSLTSRSLVRIRLAIVIRLSMKRPFLVFAQQCVKPRKSNVSGLPRPRRARLRAAKRPNSISRVFSGASSKLNLE